MFSTSALVGIFLQQLLEERVRMRYLGLSVLLGLASIGGLFWLSYADLLQHHRLNYALRQVLPPVILCLITGLGAWLHSKKLLSSTRFAWALGLLLLAELFIWMPKAHHKRVDPYASPSPYVKFIQQDRGVFRVYGLNGLLYPNTSTGYGFDDIGFLNAVTNVRYIGFSLRLIHSYIGFFDGFNVSNVDNRFFSLLNLKYLATAPWTPPPAPFFTLVYQNEANVYLNERAFPRTFIVHRAEVLPDSEAVAQRLAEATFDPRTQIVLEEEVADPAWLTGHGAPVEDGSSSEILLYGANRVVVRVWMEHAGFLVLTDAYFPGWRVWVDGEEGKIYLTDYFLRSVYLEAGGHEVEFVYRPMSYKLGLWMMVLGSGVVAALFTKSGSKVW